MKTVLEIISGFRHAGRFYEKMFEGIRGEFSVTQAEINVLAFLKNNPQYDTASDIVIYRQLPKANVSQAVELLVQKNMLRRRSDEKDRRKIHLELLPESEEILKRILEVQKWFDERMLDGVSQDHRKIFAETMLQISKNLLGELEEETDAEQK